MCISLCISRTKPVDKAAGLWAIFKYIHTVKFAHILFILISLNELHSNYEDNPVTHPPISEQKLLELITRTLAILPERQSTSSGNALDMLFKGLVLACATGIGWMTVSLPVMKDNLDDLKIAVSKIEEKTEDRFTRADFLRERESIDASIDRNAVAIARNSNALKDRTEFISNTKADIKSLKKHHEPK